MPFPLYFLYSHMQWWRWSTWDQQNSKTTEQNEWRVRVHFGKKKETRRDIKSYWFWGWRVGWWRWPSQTEIQSRFKDLHWIKHWSDSRNNIQYISWNNKSELTLRFEQSSYKEVESLYNSSSRGAVWVISVQLAENRPLTNHFYRINFAGRRKPIFPSCTWFSEGKMNCSLLS